MVLVLKDGKQLQFMYITTNPDTGYFEFRFGDGTSVGDPENFIKNNFTKDNLSEIKIYDSLNSDGELTNQIAELELSRLVDISYDENEFMIVQIE